MGGRLAWWVGPVNGLMAPAARRGRREPGSSFSALAARAARRTGVPEPADPQFLADLRVLHESFLAVPELSFMGLAGVRAELLRHLSNRLRVREYLRAYPQIASVPVLQPVFVVGLPRTGTTLLHALLASVHGHRSLAEVTMCVHNRRVDLRLLGRDWAQMWAQAVAQAMRARAGAAQQFLDVSYTQLAARPLPTLEGIFSSLHVELTSAARQWLTSRARRVASAGPGAHHYSLARYGLSSQAVREAFSGYPA